MDWLEPGRRPPPALIAMLLPLVAAWPALAGAGDVPPGDEGPTRLLETVVVTATRRNETVYDASEAVSVVEAGAIQRSGPELLAEMLRGVPGAFFQQTTPGQGIPIIRGLKGSQVLHLVDGMRLNNAFFRNAPNQYLGLVDAYATKRAEVMRGAAPSLHGADAMGGVVQVLTPEPELPAGPISAAGRLYGSYDSAADSLVSRLEAMTGHAGSVLSGGVTWQDHGDRHTGNGTVTPSDYRVHAADLKWRRQIGAHSELMLSAQYLEQPSTPRVDELVPGFGQDSPGSSRYEFRPNRREFLHARYRLQGSARWFSQFEAHLARQVITDDRLTREFGSEAVRREFNESELDGLTLQFNSPWGHNGAADRELVWGLEYYADEVSSSRYLGSESEPGLPVRPRFPDGSSMDSAAVYAANRWEWSRLSVEAGLRYSRFEVTLPAGPETGSVQLTPSDFTGDLHVGYQLRPGMRLVANAGRGFRPPNVFDLGTLGSRPGNRFNVPNPDLGPESVWSYDVGFKLSTDAWQAEAYAWYADYRDRISTRFTGATTADGRRVVRSDNLNRAQLYGFESGLRYLSGSTLELYAVLNYTRAEERDADGMTEPGDRVPPLNGRLGIIWEPASRWRLDSYLDFAGSQNRLSSRDESDPRIDPTGTPGWGTLNLLLSWQLTQRAQLGLRALNLGDRAYREHGSGIDAPGRSLGAWFDAAF